MNTQTKPTQTLLNKEVKAFFKQTTDKNYTAHIDKPVTYKKFLNNKMLIIYAIRKGIPISLFTSIKDYGPFTDQDWANFLDVSLKSLQRYKSSSDHSFKPIHSEKIIEMAEVTEVGLDVFGEMEKLKQWLNLPNYALGNLKPIELLKDSYGKELVISELIRINHGIFV